METENAEGAGRMIGLAEIMIRSGLSKSYFYNYRSRKTLGLPLEKVDGTLQCRESDFSAWMADRQFMYASRIHRLPGELLLIVGEAADDPEISEEKYPEIFLFIPSLLNDRLTALVETMKMDRGVSLEEFPERFRLAANEIERGICEEFPQAAAAVLASVFYDQVLKAHTAMYHYVKNEHRKFFRGHIRLIADDLRRCRQRTLEEKMGDLDRYISDELWAYAGYSLEERLAISREALTMQPPECEASREAGETLRQVGVVLASHVGRAAQQGGEA